LGRRWAHLGRRLIKTDFIILGFAADSGDKRSEESWDDEFPEREAPACPPGSLPCASTQPGSIMSLSLTAHTPFALKTDGGNAVSGFKGLGDGIDALAGFGRGVSTGKESQKLPKPTAAH
jgi:hypothetical protein